MRLFIIFIIALAFLSAPIVAQEDGTGTGTDDAPTPSPREAEVSSFLTKAQQFGETNLKQYLTADQYQSYLSNLQQISQSVNADDLNGRDKFGYNAAAYYNMVQQKWNTMSSDFSKASNVSSTNMAKLKRDYANQIADLTKNYYHDMVNGTDTPITLGQYTQDFDNVNSTFNSQLSSMSGNNNSSSSTRFSFNPHGHLDKSVPATTRQPIKLELIYGGLDDKYMSYTMYGLLSRIKSAYSNDTGLQKDLDWFMKVWPQSNELNVMSAKTVSTDVYGTGSGTNYSRTGSRSFTKLNGSYYINEYGQMMQKSDYDSMKPGTITPIPSRVDSSYNGRRYGWSGGGGKYPTIKLTVGNKKYELHDSIFVSPIVLDMDGDGKLQASKGLHLPHPYRGGKVVEFDINGDGFMDLTEWVGPNDGLLLVKPANGERVNANHLFGYAGGFADGFEKLALYDANKDRVLKGDELKALSVWQDKNGNAKIDSGEIKTLSELGITAIALNHRLYVSHFVQNGKKRKMWDWHPTVFYVKRKK